MSGCPTIYAELHRSKNERHYALAGPASHHEREILRARRKEEMPNPAKTTPKNPVATTRMNSPGAAAGGACV